MVLGEGVASGDSDGAGVCGTVVGLDCVMAGEAVVGVACVVADGVAQDDNRTTRPSTRERDAEQLR